MSHFKYEINERNLRMQLKENLIPFSEEAWQKFENFSITQKNFHHEGTMKRFNVSFNRNIILPVVFGGVIVLFSVLLFNFVNIKNPNQETTAEAKPEPAVVSKPTEVQKEIEAPPPVQKQITPIVTNDSAIVTTPQEIQNEQPETTNVIAGIEKPVIKVQKRKEILDTGMAKTDISTETSKTEKNITAPLTIPETVIETPKKKKKKKRPLIATEPTEEEDGQAPPPVSQASASSSGEIQ